MAFRFFLAAFCISFLTSFPGFAAEPVRIVVLGDSLVSGYGLKPKQEYPSRLENALKAKGHDVRVDNAGLAGDTTAGGLARMDTALDGDPKPALFLVELGANDMLRAEEVKQTEGNLRQILQKLKDLKIPAFLLGMQAPLNMPPAYRKEFNAVYPKLAKEFDVPLYPYFLEGVDLNPKMRLVDGIHPSAAGVDLMVEKTLPQVDDMLKDMKR